jgi:hypothetical protein
VEAAALVEDAGLEGMGAGTAAAGTAGDAGDPAGKNGKSGEDVIDADYKDVN